MTYKVIVMYRLTICVSGPQVDANVLSKAVYYADIVAPKFLTTLSLSKLPHLALPRIGEPLDEVIDNLRELERLCRGRASLIGVQCDVTNGRDIESLSALIRETQMTMLSLHLNDERIETIASVVKLLKELGVSWVDYARISISTGDVLTANLPISNTENDSFIVSLNVLDDLELTEDLRTELREKVTKLYLEACDKCSSLRDEIKLEFLGVDVALMSGSKLSLSQLLEVLRELPFYSVGTLSELMRLSSYLSSLELKRSINLGKFILSYPSDPLLNNYASMETMTLKDFAYLSISPVIGLDMLVIPSWTSKRVLLSFFEEVSELSKLARKGTFVRVVLADAEPGEKVSIGEHDVTVIEPLL